MIDLSLGASELLPNLCATQIAEPNYVPGNMSEEQLARYGQLFGLQLHPSEMLLTGGASQALIVSIMYLRDKMRSKNPKLISFSPFYPGYKAIAKLTGLEFVTLPLHSILKRSELFSNEISAFDDAIWILNFPHNPTGRSLGEAQFAKLLTDIRSAGQFAIWDAVYAGVLEQNPYSREMLADTITVGSFSKSMALAGERVGFLQAPPKDLQELARLSWQLFLSPSSAGVRFAQLRTYGLTEEIIENSRQQIRRNCDRISRAFKALRVKPSDTAGPFVWVPRVDESVYPLLIDVFKTHEILIANGTPFGGPSNSLRINAMCDDAKIDALIACLKSIDGCFDTAKERLHSKTRLQ